MNDRRSVWYGFALGFALACLAPAARGQSALNAQDDAAGEARTEAETETRRLRLAPEDAPERAPRTQGSQESELISIALDDVEMVDVIRMFTRISGSNIIASPTNLQGRVTVNLTNVEWRPALQSILDMHGLALTERTPGSGVYSVVSKPPGAPEPQIVTTLFLKYTTVAEVAPTIRTMLASEGTLSEFPSRNALVVRGTAANLGEINRGSCRTPRVARLRRSPRGVL